MDNALLKNLTPVQLEGAIVYHNQDRTYAKAFVGDGKDMRSKGFSTDEKWKPDALDLMYAWLAQQGIATNHPAPTPNAPAETKHRKSRRV